MAKGKGPKFFFSPQKNKECERELRSTVEDWVLVGLRLGHPLPQLKMLLRQVEAVLGRKITADEWDQL